MTCDRRRPYPARARTNCPQVQQFGKDLEARLADHEHGKGARLTQVQLERGGTWRLASAEPGTRDREAQLKERGATRRCQIYRADTEAAEPEPEAGL